MTCANDSRSNRQAVISSAWGVGEFPFGKAYARLGDAFAAQEGQRCWCQLRITDDAVRRVCHEQMLTVRKSRGHFLGGYKEYGLIDDGFSVRLPAVCGVVFT